MLKPKGGLGKGLGALIPITTSQVADVAVDVIAPNPRQPRQTLDALDELADSIREHGIIQPLLVSETTPQDRQISPTIKYQIIAGERRWQAAKIAGLAKVPVMVKDVTPQQALEVALVENIQRADLTPLEEAEAYRQLTNEFGLTQEKVAAIVGKNRTTVANALRLLGLPEEIRAALAGAKISEGHARALLGLVRRDDQLIALGETLRRDLSVRQTEELVRRMRAKPRTPAGRRGPTPHAQALEDEFRNALGTKVSVFASRKGGKLVIHFYSEEQLQAIYDLIVGRQRFT
ncbi:MAG: ParB/RepB/Spo0J family partition protein [Chloroflexi bacterium]|nr:ParB/RepB/Spo0J family partition protein [Chloroflexota bacterium]